MKNEEYLQRAFALAFVKDDWEGKDSPISFVENGGTRDMMTMYDLTKEVEGIIYNEVVRKNLGEAIDSGWLSEERVNNVYTFGRDNAAQRVTEGLKRVGVSPTDFFNVQVNPEIDRLINLGQEFFRQEHPLAAECLYLAE
jgi:hypothetical protein